MEIAPGIHQIHCAFGNRRMVFVYLLVGETASLLVDTGCAHNPAQEILPYMASIGFDPTAADLHPDYPFRLRPPRRQCRHARRCPPGKTVMP